MGSFVVCQLFQSGYGRFIQLNRLETTKNTTTKTYQPERRGRERVRDLRQKTENNQERASGISRLRYRADGYLAGMIKAAELQLLIETHTHLDAQRFVDGQDLEHEGEIAQLLKVAKVMRMRLQQFDQENTGVPLFGSFNEIASLRHHTARAIGVGAHPELGVHLALLGLEALVLQRLQLGHHAVGPTLAPGIVLNWAIQASHGGSCV